MEPKLFFELAIGVVMIIIALHFAAHKLNLPPSLALLAGGALLAFAPGLPAISVDPEMVLVIFLPPLLMDGAWSIPVSRLRRQMLGVTSLAVGAVVFTCAAVAAVAHLLFPTLPWAVCATLGAIVSPPDAISARAALARVKLPKRLQVLLEGESLLNDATGLVLFRFAVAAVVTGGFSAAGAVGNFFVLALGGVAVGALVGMAWVKTVRRLNDEYLMISATVLLSWTAYMLGEAVHVSGVIATVTTGLIASWNQHTVFSASTRIRGTSFWTVVIFLMEAAVFVLIGLSLRDVVGRGGGFGVVFSTLALPMLAILATLVVARFIWVFASEFALRACTVIGLKGLTPVGLGGATVLGWAGARGVVTLALALSVPESFPGRDLILVTSFAVIVGTVLVQGTTLGRVIRWARLTEPEAEKARISLSEADAAMAKAQLGAVRRLAYDGDELVHPMLLDRYERRTRATVDYVDSEDDLRPKLEAHFDVVLEAIAAGRRELIRLHRAGDIDDDTLANLERDLDLEELGALAAKS